MVTNRTNLELVRAIVRDPQATLNLMLAVDEIIADFHEWGPVLQADEHGEYTAETAIARLEAVRNAIRQEAGWAPS